MRRHRGVTREELNQSAAVAVAVLLGIGLVTAWNVLIPGVAAWENTVVAVVGSLRHTGPVAAAFAAWVALRVRRARRRRAPAPGPWRALRVPLAVLAVVVGAFGATVVVLALRTAVSDQAGRLPPSGLLAGAAGLAFFVALGWIAGWALPRGITPIAVLAAGYAISHWTEHGPDWAGRLGPSIREPYDLFGALDPELFTGQALWLTGAGAALLLGWSAVVSRRVLPAAAAVVALVAAGAGVARLLAPAARAQAAGPVAYACQEWPITVCVHPGMRAGLDELSARFIGLASRVAGTPAAFSRVEQHSRRHHPELPAGTVAIHVDDLRPGYADRAVAEFTERLAPRCAEPAGGYREIVMGWLRGGPIPAGPLPEHRRAAAWFSGLTEAQRRDWLQLFYTDFARCGLTVNHFADTTPPSGPATLATHDVYPVNPSPGHVSAR
ncbi:hypothetical protein GCM10010106_35570 [Thermopolyspora flexuosa]|uniref:Uncharacterized protein n=1 Tax=Thermopolyspora flexuosa TaxID=103836 RepID=A0A543J1A4_9ACTN|nr:hypothetical protein [Thermopolyspora flexuosa]TQM76611.1 hypothetical protein FHX40_3356 [Thermopolyspora flexuosa]GGM85498.1 hypothetical protein GCM10010106_35570 [Thermopolyspora flexuosa]